MAEIHKKQQQQQNNRHLSNIQPSTNSVYNANLVQASRGYQLATIHSSQSDIRNDYQQHQDQHQNQSQHQQREAAVINIDPNLNFIKTKDLDTVSIASSMHFTMVNGEAGANKKIKKGLCDRGRQVTVLIVTMSTIFLLLIIGMVYALESKYLLIKTNCFKFISILYFFFIFLFTVRAREMPQS